MTTHIANLLNQSGGWLEWPDEARPDGVTWAAAHRDAGVYLYGYADGSAAVFCARGEGHLCGFGPLIADRPIAVFLRALVESRT